ncbi:MAG: energy-coupling factor transporter transmembrane protein EcfT [Mycoplasmataceae bacterium]|nr:energy-coupling factor transporter transmembrane protein EcfT [Mycoplasmataceae bacterium]
MKINIGRYIHSNSLIHKLDARVKIFGTVSFIVLILLSTTFFTSFILLSILISTFVVATKKPWKLFGMMLTPLWITIFIFIINIFTNHIPDNATTRIDIYWEYTPLSIQLSMKTIVDTLNIALRIYSVLLAMTILTLTTKPVLLTKALEFYFMPLKWIKIPVNIFVQIITIALRFIPTILDEAGRILKAQASRGVDFSNGNLKTKIKATIVLIIPLFVSAFTKAEDLSNAMETRGYDPYAKRVSYRKWHLSIIGGLCFVALLSLIVTISLILNDVIVVPDWWSNMPTKLT